MSQGSLFGDIATFDPMPDTAPHQDAPTSRAAAEAFRPKLGARRREVLAFIASRANVTDEEIIDEMESRGRSRNGPRARRRELDQAHLIEVAGMSFHNSEHGRRTWKISDAGRAWLESDE